MDYRRLLKKYMNHVGECEGTVFLSPSSRLVSPGISEDEWKELFRIADEPE